MKNITFGVLLLFSSCKPAQELKKESVQTQNKFEIPFEFETLESRRISEYLICSIVFEKKTRQFIAFVVKEDLSHDEVEGFIDIQLLGLSGENEVFEMCTYGDNSPYDDVIGLEFNDNGYLVSESDTIIKAWKFSVESNKFEEMNVTGLYRKGEHYYRR
jgi:hypothetical protein